MGKLKKRSGFLIRPLFALSPDWALFESIYRKFKDFGLTTNFNLKRFEYQRDQVSLAIPLGLFYNHFTEELKQIANISWIFEASVKHLVVL